MKTIAPRLLRLLCVTVASSVLCACSKPPVSVGQKSPVDGILLTREQLAAVQVSQVAILNFQDEERTDGRLAYDDELTTPVFSQFSGPVTQVLVREGDHVVAGQPMLIVAATEWVQARNDLLTAKAGLATATAQMAQAETNQERLRGLVAAKSAATKDWLQSQTDLLAAKGNLASAQAALEAVLGRLRAMGASTAQIEDLQMQQLRKGAASSWAAIVRAPVTGTVVLRQVAPGQLLGSLASGASSPIFTIADMRKLWLVADVHEVNAGRVRVGQKVSVRLPAFPDKIFEASISSVAAALDPSSHRLAVRAVVDNTHGLLHPGMFASFAIVTSPPTSALAVPERAIVHIGGECRVYVVGPDNRVRIRVIQAGRSRDDGMVEVTQGLHLGERVVTAGALFIDRAISTRADSA